MKIRDILAKNEPTLSFEVFPPKTEDKYESVEAAASEIAKLNPAFMSVTYGAGGGTSQYTVDIAASLKAKGVTPLAHLTCVSSTREKVHSVLDQLKAEGKKVVLAAADTFRAAAIDQLAEWANRAGVELIAQKEGSDPAAVIYDAVAAAKSRHADVLICDTAGRLHNKKNLMEELKKINRIIDKEYPDAYRETLVVLDGTTGQNAMAQARQFMEVADITGIILTKLDGTAKGGIAVAIQSELGLPVKYIGVGEHIDDLQKFNADDFVNALFNVSDKN
mgnify:CR=1 FL=1